MNMQILTILQGPKGIVNIYGVDLRFFIVFLYKYNSPVQNIYTGE